MIQYRKNPTVRLGSGRGFSLLEVLVTIVILSVGLLGLAGLQGRALTAQMESYQRSQAMVLLKDMADRIDLNRKNAASYVTTGLTPAYLGVGASCNATCNASGVCNTTANTDLCAWNNALQGTSEKLAASAVGAMIDARGCVYQTTAPASGVAETYSIVVAWRGLNYTFAPDIVTATSAGKCGYNLYTDKSGASVERLHRVISLPIAMADLL